MSIYFLLHPKNNEIQFQTPNNRSEIIIFLRLTNSHQIFASTFQALYNIVFWPYTLKLIWAPLIDALYIQWIGRRKSWLLPVQFIAGKSTVLRFNDS